MKIMKITQLQLLFLTCGNKIAENAESITGTGPGGVTFNANLFFILHFILPS